MRPWRGFEPFGSRRRSGQGAEGAMSAQESLEDGDRRSIVLRHLGWLAHQSAVEAMRFDVAGFERSLDARVEFFCVAFIAAGPEDAVGLRCGGERKDRL